MPPDPGGRNAITHQCILITKKILVFSEDPTQGLDHTSMKAEATIFLLIIRLLMLITLSIFINI